MTAYARSQVRSILAKMRECSVEQRDAMFAELVSTRFGPTGVARSNELQQRHIEAIRARATLCADRRSSIGPLFLRPSLSRNLLLAAVGIGVIVIFAFLVWNYAGSPSTKDDLVRIKPGTQTAPSQILPKGFRKNVSNEDIQVLRRNPAGGRFHPGDNAPASSRLAGTVELVLGSPSVHGSGSHVDGVAAHGSALWEGSIIVTGDLDKADLKLVDGSLVRLGFNSKALVLEPGKGIRLETGTAWLVVKERSHPEFRVETSLATAEVLGTEFGIEVEPAPNDGIDRLTLQVKSGKVALTNRQGRVVVGPFTESMVELGEAPTPPRRLPSLGSFQLSAGGLITDATARIPEIDAIARLAFPLGLPGLVISESGENGCAVVQVAETSTAHAAGIRSRDRLVALNDRPIQSEKDFYQYVFTHPEEKVRLRVLREGKELTFEYLIQRPGIPLPSIPEDLSTNLYAATVRAIQGDFVGAHSALQSLQKKRTHAAIENNLGIIALVRDDWPRATRFLESAAIADPKALLYRWNLAYVLRTAGNARRAVQELEAAISLRPDAPVAIRAELIECYKQLRMWDRATQSVTEWTQRYATDSQVWELRSSVELLTGRRAEAAASAQRAVELRPGNVAAMAALAIALQELGNLDQSIAIHREIVKLSPESAIAWSNLGSALRSKKIWDEAETACQRAIELEAGMALGYLNLGTIRFDQNRLWEAENLFRKSISLDPALPQNYGNLAMIFERRSDKENAIRLYRKAVEVEPSSARGNFNLGSLLVDSGILQEAEVALREACRLAPDWLSPKRNLALCVYLQGKKRESVELYRQILKIAPNDNFGLTGIVWSLMELEENLGEALSLGLRCSELYPADMNAAANVGWVLFKLNRIEEAEAYLDRALKGTNYGEGADSSDTWWLRGQVKEKLNKIDEAKESYGHAIEVSGKNLRAKEALKRIS